MYNNEYAKELEKANKHSELFQYVIQYANTQNPQALNMIARCYYYGHGTEKDYSACFLYDQKAADTNDGDALATLGWDYENGVGTEKNIEFALQFYQKSVDLESNKGYCFLGLCYQDGIGMEKDESKAVQYYTVAAERGYAMAQRRLGVCYEYGIGVDKDEAKAFELYTQAAEQGGAISQRYLAECYAYGTGVRKNISKAIEWYTKSAEQGDWKSQQKLGEIYFYSDDDISIDYEKALYWFEKAKGTGGTFLWLHLGMCYAHTSKSEADRAKVFESYVQAVQSENTNDFFYSIACYELARYYENGWHTNQDYKKAFELYLKSAELNCSEAQVKVAEMLENGIGTNKNEKHAIDWYQKAASQNNALALACLSNHYEKGVVVPKNICDAIKGFKTASNLFDDAFNQALCFEHIADCIKQFEDDGTPFEENSKTYYEKALKKYLELADTGDGEAHLHVAEFFEFGKGIDSNRIKAFEHYETAARILDSGYSNFILAKCYELGIGVTQNYKKAFELFKKSGHQGYSIAKAYVGYCYERGMGVKKNYDRAITIYKECLSEDKNIDSLANLYLGLCYYHGVGTKEDPETAKEYFQKVSTVGTWYIDIIEKRFKSSTSLGMLYAHSNIAVNFNLIADPQRAVTFLNIAKEHGFITVEQALELEAYYRLGKGIPRNKRIALNILATPLFEHTDNEIALRRIGQHYFYGHGIQKDRRKALSFFERAMYKGDAISKVYVSLYYANGYEVEQNYHKATDILKTEQHNNNFATAFLGLLMCAGAWGLEKNHEEALRLLQQVANEGSPYITQDFCEWMKELKSDSLCNLLIKIFISRLHYQTFDPSVKWRYLVRFLPQLFIKLIKSPKSNNKETTISMLFAENQKLKGENIALRGDLEKLEQFRNIGERIERVEATMQKGFGELGDKIDQGIDTIREMLNQILCWCSSYTMEKKKVLNGSQDEEKIAQFIDETANKIIDRVYDGNVVQSSDFIQVAESELKGLFGADWDKLDFYTRRSLVSAKVFLAQSEVLNDESLDFSGIVVSATSALEKELKLRLFVGAQKYFAQKAIPISNWPELLKFYDAKNEEWIENTDFTLGKLSFLLFPRDENDRIMMNDYLTTILRNNQKQYGSRTFSYRNPKSFMDRCKEITDNYRNPAAHTEPVGMSLAIDCCDNIIGAAKRVGAIQGLILELLSLTDNYENPNL